MYYRVERKKRSREWKQDLVPFGFPHTPYFNVGGFWVFWSVQKNALVYVCPSWRCLHVQHWSTGCGGCCGKRWTEVASVFLARPGLRTVLWENVFGLSGFARVYFTRFPKYFRHSNRRCFCSLLLCSVHSWPLKHLRESKLTIAQVYMYTYMYTELRLCTWLMSNTLGV